MGISEGIKKARKKHRTVLNDIISKEEVIITSLSEIEKSPEEELVFISNRIAVLENFLKNLGRERRLYNKIPVHIKDNTLVGVLKKNLKKS
jgi:hypothetical protein